MAEPSKSDFISYEELFNVVESGEDSTFKTAAGFLLAAISDWPLPGLSEPSDFIFELKSLVKDKLTFDNLSNYSKSLNLNKAMWEIEALTELLEVFDFERKNIQDKAIELDAIVLKITKHYRDKNN